MDKQKKARHLLIVDDEEIVLKTLDRMLTGVGYRVTATDSGESALEILEEQKEEGETFDLVLTDIKMPGISGIELIDEMFERGFSIPVVGITGYGDKAIVIDLLRPAGLLSGFPGRTRLEPAVARFARRTRQRHGKNEKGICGNPGKPPEIVHLGMNSQQSNSTDSYYPSNPCS